MKQGLQWSGVVVCSALLWREASVSDPDFHMEFTTGAVLLMAFRKGFGLAVDFSPWPPQDSRSPQSALRSHTRQEALFLSVGLLIATRWLDHWTAAFPFSTSQLIEGFWHLVGTLLLASWITSRAAFWLRATLSR